MSLIRVEGVRIPPNTSPSSAFRIRLSNSCLLWSTLLMFIVVPP
jgi:hypothetical protein